MVDRQRGHPFPTGVEERVATDEQCNSPTLAAFTSLSSFSASGVFKFGYTSIAIAPGLGTNWRSSSSRFVTDAVERKLTPVALPPGRLRLATRPLMTGSSPVTTTIGTVVVAALAVLAELVFPTVRATCWRAKSATRAGNRWA